MELNLTKGELALFLMTLEAANEVLDFHGDDIQGGRVLEKVMEQIKKELGINAKSRRSGS